MVIHTIAAAAAALRSGTVSSADLIDASLQAVDRHNARTNAFIRIDAAAARSSARLADDERKQGIDRGPLHGVPISLKDLIDVAGQTTTAASRVLNDRVATADAPVVTRLRDAGAIVIGKTNLHEFALGTTCEDSAFGPVRHPRDASRSPGGSSGGSAAAVATGMGLASIGTDTGGSIRIPAAACGIVGLKPSFGEVPTEGVIPLSATLDHVGPLGRTVQDVGWLWAALAGRPMERVRPPDAATLRLGRLGGYFSLVSDEVRAAFEDALRDLTVRGVAVSESTVAHADAIAPAYVHLVLPEGAAWHAQYLDSRPADYTPNVRARFEAGRSISAVDYLKAREARRTFRDAIDGALAECDALVLPTLPIVAPLLGESEVLLGVGDRSERVAVRAAMLRQTQLFNITGHPAISLPLRTPGLPVGLQLVGARGRTARLLDVASAIEQIVCPA